MIEFKDSRLTRIFLVCLAGFCFACTHNNEEITLFKSLSAESTGITFRNDLSFNQEFNIYTYRNFYNGGGVGIGDFNNDGFMDIYFTSNQSSNKLYINKGNLQFEDITDKAGVNGTKSWSTGVALADVNGDGLLDIYVCNSGDVKGDDKENELFINNGDLTFSEKAREYGLADKGFTTHAVFFDYDRDGDLDLYILNNSYQAIGSFNLMKNERPNRDKLGGDKLMRNDGGHFTDVSEEAGIYGSIIGFGLGATVGDVNKDGWPDIYVSNDFFERDYLYINNKDGSFKECLTEQMKSISAASMGADMADINNDGWPEIFVTDMLPNDYKRLKTITTFENWDRYQYNVSNDYYHQFNRNMLQLNNRNSTFSEIGRLAGVEATDWSWGALIFDMDNDGLKDIFVANGIYQDLTNQDYLQYISNDEVVKSIVSGNKVNYKTLVDLIPSNPVPNFAFKNSGELIFLNKSTEWGFGTPNFSNGSAYGDLDNDGDLDLVISHVNNVASVHRNESNTLFPNNHYLQFNLIGQDKNKYAIGTSIEIRHQGKTYSVEQIPNRGFESSVDMRPFVGLGALTRVDSIWVRWPNGLVTELHDIATNQVLTLNQADAVEKSLTEQKIKQQFTVVNTGIDYKHEESDFVDFDRDKLIYHMLSTTGPSLSVGDVNGDGLEDIYLGGAKGQSGSLFIQTSNGDFRKSTQPAFEADAASEDIKSLFFDADGDGDMDLYVCSGSSEFTEIASALTDRLYLNDGKRNYNRSLQALPGAKFENTSVVKACDFDADGDMDLFVGIRAQALQYGMPVNGYLLKNDGKGRFEDVTAAIAPGFLKLGMIADAAWADLNGDQRLDIIIVGDYMNVEVFLNLKDGFVRSTSQFNLDKTHGWWNTVLAEDMDQDGDLDIIVGNHGLNSRFSASSDAPLTLLVNDFDKNGTTEQILCFKLDGKEYPVALRHDLTGQMPGLKKQFLKYEDFKDKSVDQIFDKKAISEATVLNVTELRSGVFVNEGGRFIFKPFPAEAQLSPVFSMYVDDFNADGNKDILLGGNLYEVKPEVGRYDASYGQLLSGLGNGNYKVESANNSGFLVDGQIRNIQPLLIGKQKHIIAVRNNDSPVILKVEKTR
ncbi:MAG: hypothetical protein BroJett042_25620 [Bacteroidota bacterium]|nr:MAG: hypothetical protein BroJett042_25620 [Bacteroidota bacterium]